VRAPSEDLLQKLKLRDQLILTLDIPRFDLTYRLLELVEEGDPKSHMNPFEAFSTNRRSYIGRVNEYGFKVRKKRTFFHASGSSAMAVGIYQEQDDRLSVKVDLQPLHKFTLYLLPIVLVFYVLLISMFSASGSADTSFYLFITLHALLMMVLPIFMMRSGIRKLKKELDRDLALVVRDHSKAASGHR
jgi:hypothetical protein